MQRTPDLPLAASVERIIEFITGRLDRVVPLRKSGKICKIDHDMTGLLGRVDLSTFVFYICHYLVGSFEKQSLCLAPDSHGSLLPMNSRSLSFHKDNSHAMLNGQS